jgi:putative ABC transport system ATP-binding protein
MLHVDHVEFCLPNGQVILKDINFTVNQGEFVLLLGSNGSGKSSLIRCINREYRITKGDIQFDHRSIHKINSKSYAQQVITLTQFVKDSLFFDLSIVENARLLDDCYGFTEQHSSLPYREQLTQLLDQYHPTLSNAIEQPLFNLSGGEQQILAFALYLRYHPKLLLLDEHTSALDPKTAAMIMKFTAQVAKAKQLTCIMTTHNLDVIANYGNRVIALKEGQIQFDSINHPQPLPTDELLAYCY